MAISIDVTTFDLGHLNDDVVVEVDVEEALKSSIFIVQKAAAPKSGIEFRQDSSGMPQNQKYPGPFGMSNSFVCASHWAHSSSSQTKKLQLHYGPKSSFQSYDLHEVRAHELQSTTDSPTACLHLRDHPFHQHQKLVISGSCSLQNHVLHPCQPASLHGTRR